MQLIKYLVYFILFANTLLYAMSATQSSTGRGGVASRAIDGNTNGSYTSLSVTHTHMHRSTPYEWLLIDLEKTNIIDTIKLWNRTDCCSDRLASVYVMTSTTPFLPDTTEDALVNALAQSDWHQQVVSDTNGMVEIPFELNSTVAQYLLIQKAGPGFNVSNYLSLAEVEFTFKPSADLDISKSAPNEVEQNSKFDYTLDIQNHGDTLAENVIVSDHLPGGVVYNGYTAPSGWSCNYAGGQITCTISKFDVDENAQIKIDVFAPDTTGSISNTATIKSDTSDPDTSNNSSTVTTTVTATNIDLSIIKNAPNSVNTTSQFDYTLTVSNNGSSIAKNIQVKDTLPSEVLFVTTTTDSSWVCSQGATITCDYQGTLASGQTTSAITITVTSPATATTVTNTASVTPNDNVPANNVATATTQVNNNINTGGDVNLTKLVQYNIFGDMLLLGNANINFRGADPQQGYNDRVNMQFVDTDNDATTFNSSSSMLNLPANARIKQALLYWSGNLCTNATGCNYANMPNLTNVTNALNAARTIKLKTPSNTNYIDITANNFNTVTRVANATLTHNKYTAFADITRFLRADESGTFTVANIPLTEGLISNGGNYGGWGMIVVYEDTTSQTSYRNISIYNGFQNINSDGNTFTITDFVTPLSGSINASLSFFAADGDPAQGGTGTMLDANTGLMQNLGGDTLNPVTNLLNSTISTFGVATNTGITKTYGIDLDRINVSNFMKNNQKSTNFSFNITNPFDATKEDFYTLSMFTFITDLSTPVINDFNKTAELIDASGTRIAGSGQPIYEGSEILYTLTFTNTGTEIAREVEVFDDFHHNNLQRALNLDNFDASKIKLSLPNSSQWQNNPNCGYSQGELKVWCKIPQVDIGDTYKMQFSVRIKDNLSGIDEDDRNLTNIAYANYKNATTGDYVILVSDNNGDFGGKSHALNSGVLTPSVHDPLILDAINVGYNYTLDKNITTKIVNSPFALKLVHLDTEGNVIEYDSSYDMDVLLTLDSNESRLLTQSTMASFRDGESIAIAENLNISQVHRDDRVKMHYINWQDKILGTTLTCTDKELKNGIPECLDSMEKLKKVFKSIPSSATVCPPVSAGTLYNHTFGCYHYLTSLSKDSNSTSTDNFSVRPAKFSLSSTSGHYPDLLRAGSKYPLDIRAVDPSDTVVTDYTAQTSDINITKTLYFNTGEPSDPEDNTTKLWGDTNITDVNITQGIGNSNISFSDVGNVGIVVVDSNWSLCDKDDTPQECNSTTNADGIDIEASAYICSDETNLTFIPHHFNVNATLYNHRGGVFTYLVDPARLANMGDMSAHVGVDIEAKNEQNVTTQNFRTGSKYYEHPIAIDMNVTQWIGNKNSPYQLTNMQNVQIDLNATVENNFTDIGPTLLGFDANGTYAHQDYNTTSNSWTEITTTYLKFNYEKVVDNPANPFTVPGGDVNITVNASYTGSAPDGTADINGTTTAGGSATFIYGRIKAAENDDYFHGVPVNNAVNTPIMAMAFCDTTAVNCANFNFLAQTNTQNWYRNTQHRQDLRDGNIVLTNAPIVNPQPNIGAGGAALTGIDLNVMTTCPAGAPQVLNINAIAGTSLWMKYVSTPPLDFALPYNLYSVECVGPSGWTGHGATGNVVGGGASNAGRNRMNW